MLTKNTQAAAPTPMMAQYLEIKAANPDSLLFYRMGDFYELFFEDAEIASRALGITLTKRGKHLDEDIPMCGVPVHAADDYLQKLIGKGFRVAVCEQLEDPAEAKKRGSKSVVRRDVTRLVTPGTITEEKLLDPSKAAISWPSGGRNRAPVRNWRSPGSTSRPASSVSRQPRRNGCCRTSCASGRARSRSPRRVFADEDAEAGLRSARPRGVAAALELLRQRHGA
jgi:hypothetical protein